MNCVIWKIMENVRKYKDEELVTQWFGRYDASNYIAKSNFLSCIIFYNDMLIVELKKIRVNFNKSIFSGLCILDISKNIL